MPTLRIVLLNGRIHTYGAQVRRMPRQGPGKWGATRVIPGHRELSSSKPDKQRRTNHLENGRKLVAIQSEDFSCANLGHGTHLTTNWGVEVKNNEVGNYSHKGCHVQKRIDLSKEKSALRLPRSQRFFNEEAVVTDPDRPPVAATTLDNAPLKVKSRKKLPAGNLRVSDILQGQKVE